MQHPIYLKVEKSSTASFSWHVNTGGYIDGLNGSGDGCVLDLLGQISIMKPLIDEENIIELTTLTSMAGYTVTIFKFLISTEAIVSSILIIHSDILGIQKKIEELLIRNLWKKINTHVFISA